MQVVIKFSMELSIQISRFGVFAQALVVTHLRIRAKESNTYKAAALMLARVNLCQYLRIKSSQSGCSSGEV